MSQTAQTAKRNDFLIDLGRDQFILIETTDGRTIKYSRDDAKRIRIVSPLSFLATHDIETANKTITLAYRCNIFPCTKTGILPDGFPQVLDLGLQNCLEDRIEDELNTTTSQHPPSNWNKWVSFTFQFSHFGTPLFIEVINLARG